MERDIKRAKGADEPPSATRKESIISDSRMELLEEELHAKDLIIARLTKENEELQQRLGLLSRTPAKKGAQTRYWRKEEHERFLEALEKFGQRDVKNISAYVGTRSPTQVRTHAQKYFLKQRREETAQMKSASSLARKRRVSVMNANAMDEEVGEDEEEEEDEEDDVLSDGENGIGGNTGSPHRGADAGANRAAGDGANAAGGADADGLAPRRKSTRSSNAAAVIKLRTQDVVAHTGNRVGGGGRYGSDAIGGLGIDNLPGILTKPIGGHVGATSLPSALSGKVKMDPTHLGMANSKKTGVGAGGAGKGFLPTTAAGAHGVYGAGLPAAANSPLLVNQPNGHLPQQARTVLGQPGGAYPGYPPYGAGGGAAYGAPSYFPFRTDIFASSDEAAQFYKAVKTYERETDRVKVLHSIKEYFLPHRTIEEISTMVDLAFPTMDPTYNAQTMAAAAAFHPLYTAQAGRAGLPYGDAGPLAGNFGPTSVANFPGVLGAAGVGPNQPLPPVAMTGPALGQQQASQAAPSSQLGSAAASSASPAAHHPKLDTLGSQTPLSYNSSLLGFGLDNDADANIPTHIDPSSLSSLSDRMSEMVGNSNKAPSNASSSSTGTPGATNPAHANTPNAASTSPSVAAMGSTSSYKNTSSGDAATGDASTTQKDAKKSEPTSAATPSPSNGSTASTSTLKKDTDKEDDSLMSELATLTERPDGLLGGGLSSFVGRPLVLSPTVFGLNTTPLGLGMTPLPASTTPLWLHSPFTLNFPGSHSPINPYFKPPK